MSWIVVTAQQPDEGMDQNDLDAYAAMAAEELRGVVDMDVADIEIRYGALESYEGQGDDNWGFHGPLTEEMKAALEAAWERFCSQ